MRTSEEIYHRVRWDPRFDPARFVLGINVRGAAPKRVPLPAFVPGGDIPWHRVLFVEADGEVLWDRAAGLDRVDASLAGRVREPRRLRAPFFTAVTPFAWDPAGGWRPAPTGPTGPTGLSGLSGPETAAARVPVPARLRVLTWNTLWDRYDGHRIATARRRPLLVEELERADADVIALQEVEAGLLGPLLGAAWVRNGYTLSADPAGRDIDDSGVLLLSRLPVREGGRHVLGPHKAVAALTVRSAAGPLVVAATHLTSDHSENGPARRDAELSRLAEVLASVDGDLILLGDLNDGGDGPARVLGLRDAWTEFHGPDDRTATFDPGTNPLAAVSSLSGRASRLDRVLLRGHGLRTVDAAVRGDSPATDDGLFLSDHYGVVADVTTDAGTDVTVTVTVTVTVGVGVGDAGEGEGAGTEGVGAGREPHPSGPEEEARAREVVERLRASLPEGSVYVAGSRRLGCALPGADLDLVAALPGPPGPPGPGGTGNAKGARRMRGTEGAEGTGGIGSIGSVEDRVRAALPEATGMRRVHGARVPGLRLRAGGLDVDLAVVVTGGLPPAEAVERRTELDEASALALSAISDADAVLAAAGADRAAFLALARQVKAWARARGLDSAPFGGLPGLAWTVLAARATREAGAPGNPGHPEDPGSPGDTGGPSRGELLRHFFGTWAAWDWSRPVELWPQAPPGGGRTPARESGPSGGDPPDDRAAVTVMTPGTPVRSCTEQVGAGGRDLLTQELYHAWEILEAAGTGPVPWSALLSPPPLHRRHAAWAVVTVRTERAGDPGGTLGRARGRMRALLTSLERAGTRDAHAWPRPFESGPDAVRFAVGLGRTPPDAAGLAGIAGPWAASLRGVDVTWAARGEVPTLT
ncbi:RNA repair domain-containing protein [Streptosporangium sp. NPDC023615]|uniref:RNA repair domain-containing protein n=1 Tax=Streptosporangium sp. NPDC023615 TaxID=3154794 RepID=UPI00343187AF